MRKVGEVGMKEYIIKVDEDKKDIMGNYPLVEKPQELVRCKDCKYGDKNGMLTEWSRYCSLWGKIFDYDWFCADGKRKDT